MPGRVGGEKPCERFIILSVHLVHRVLAIDFLVRHDDVQEQGFGGLIAQARKVRPHGVALAAVRMAGGAGAGENLGTGGDGAVQFQDGLGVFKRFHAIAARELGEQFLSPGTKGFATFQHLASGRSNGMDRDRAFFESTHEGRVVQSAAGDHA